ncbi:MAG: anhydro-N-acetylmuramic acid kinase [Nitrospirales bacterium]|nr:anhydro-N-acetylmuramic acid kinase [Nitrospirales bacterium]
MIVLGLMSGTSVDGVDDAITAIRQRGRSLQVQLLAHDSLAYSPALRDRILRVSEQGDVSEICHLNVVVGEVFAKAALKTIKRSGLSTKKVRLIGSHGQTIHHRPHSLHEPGVGDIQSTLQIGEPSVIAERTGIPTVSNFRARDLAAGGEGAPLTPYVHHLLFHRRSCSRLVVNLGGIVNITLVPAAGGLNDIQAFDVGPGNMLLDGIMQALSHGKLTMDRGGGCAKRGQIRRRLLEQLFAHPFMDKAPPKSTGREEFGRAFIQRVLSKARRNHWSTADILATSCRFIALSISRAQHWIRPRIDEVIVGGGGVYNPVLMAELVDEFHPVPVKRMEDCGSHSKAFEAKAFAVLAYQTLHGKVNNVPAVTGARHPVILGNLTPGRPEKNR